MKDVCQQIQNHNRNYRFAYNVLESYEHKRISEDEPLDDYIISKYRQENGGYHVKKRKN